MRIKHTLLASLAATLLSPAIALAEQHNLQVSVEAQVPSPDGLQISPVGDWAGVTQRMNWNIATQTLDPIQRQLNMKSGLGEIKAYLTDAALLTSGANSIEMNVSVHGKALTVGPTTPAVILTDVEAAAGRQVDVRIAAAAAPVGGYVAGTYQGNVFMMFESVAP